MTKENRCACGGAAENCVHCFGSGFYIPADLSSSFHRPPTHAKDPPADPPRKWATSFKEAALEAAKAWKQERIPAQFVKCPFCTQTGLGWEIKKHAALVHDGEIFRYSACELVDRGSKNGLTQKSGGDKSLGHQGDPRDLTKAQTRRFDHLDATRGVGHFAREGSKFGSHPLHDGYDDESGA
jgi:hypothetical protein